jgi:tripartite-type tricarboxylate transporter receptor subunit TctC
VRALAVTSRQRFAELPGVPTVMESGVPGYDVSSWNALAAPARTPHAVIHKLNGAVQAALRQEALARRLRTLGVRAQTGSPEQLATLLRNETQRWGEVIRRARIEPQ